MADVVFYVVIAVYAVFLAAMIWALTCNQRTHNHRVVLIEEIAKAIEASDYQKSYWRILYEVSYEQHMWRLLTFRDPWAIYPPELSEVRRVS
jgi:hypothetical protein